MVTNNFGKNGGLRWLPKKKVLYTILVKSAFAIMLSNFSVGKRKFCPLIRAFLKNIDDNISILSQLALLLVPDLYCDHVVAFCDYNRDHVVALEDLKRTFFSGTLIF